MLGISIVQYNQFYFSVALCCHREGNEFLNFFLKKKRSAVYLTALQYYLGIHRAEKLHGYELDRMAVALI
jgi:hypothetical protein